MAERDEGAFERLEGDRLAAEALAAGRPTGWFEPLYARAEATGDAPPWHRDEARPLLVDWAQEQDLRGEGRTAAVVGAGLGSDAEYLAGLGFDDVLGFDVSPTAVRVAAERSTHANARYEVGDLFALPGAWRGAFDLVVEIWTVQSLPLDVRAEAIAAIASLVAPGGRLLAIAWERADADGPLRAEPPWPLTRAELESFGAPPLRSVKIERIDDFLRGEFAR
jgi:SAM-dependent methyltransferase